MTPPDHVWRARLTGVAATLAVLAILAGLPAVLVAVGGIPDQWPTPHNVLDSLTRPDDGTAAVVGLIVVGWLAWIVLAASILAEIAAAVRGRTVRALPGLGLPQGAARVLVTTAGLLFVSFPLMTPPAAIAAMTPTMSSTAVVPQPSIGTFATTGAAGDVPAAQGSVEHGPGPRRSTAPRAGASAIGRLSSAPGPRHVVKRGDSLWSIAQTHLGSGRRYPEIAALNRDILGHRPEFLLPGTSLRLPQTTTEPAGPAGPDRPDTAGGRGGRPPSCRPGRRHLVRDRRRDAGRPEPVSRDLRGLPRHPSAGRCPPDGPRLHRRRLERHHPGVAQRNGGENPTRSRGAP